MQEEYLPVVATTYFLALKCYQISTYCLMGDSNRKLFISFS